MGIGEDGGGIEKIFRFIQKRESLYFHKLSPTSYFECDVFCDYLFQIFCPDSMHDQFLKHGEHPCRVQVDRKVGYIDIHLRMFFFSYL